MNSLNSISNQTLLDSIRKQLVDSLLTGVAILACFQFVSLLLRSNVVDDPLYYFRLAIQVTFIGLYFFRKSLPHQYVAWLIVIAGFFAGASSVLSFGSSAGGILILLITVIASGLVLNFKVASLLFILSLVPIFYHLVQIANGSFVYTSEMTAMNSSPYGWLFQVILYMYMAVLIGIILKKFFMLLIQANDRLSKEGEGFEQQAKASGVLLETALNAIPYRVFWKDNNSRYVGANKNFLQDVGFERLEDILGKRDDELPWKERASQILADDQEMLKSGLAKFNQEMVVKDSDRNQIHIQFNKVPMKDNDGNIVGIIGAYNDISDRKELELHLQRAIEDAEAANNAKSQFLANMSHELRTPLNGVYGLLNILLTNASNEEQRELLIKAKHSTDILKAIINDVLDISKIEANKMDIEQIPFCVDEVLQNIRITAESLAQEKSLNVQTITDFDESLFLIGDPTRLSQILINLISNAIKFTEKGSIRIQLSHQDEWLNFSVADTGIGIKDEVAAALFENFTQADSTITRKFGGTGLGLAITKKLTALMEGEISVESEYGKGSRFFGRVKAVPVAAERNTGLKISNPTDLAGRKILLIEDNEINRLIASRCLESAGAHVDEAENGKVGVDMFTSGQYDVVLLDIQMPVMDGLEAIRKLREQSNLVPIIALTANVLAHEVKLYLELGFNAHIAKPFEPEELLSVIANQLN